MTGADIAIIVAASALGALVKGVTGMGYPLLAVPLIALATGVGDAVVVVAVPNLAANVFLCAEARAGRSHTRDLTRIIAAGSVGAVVGTVALVSLPEEPLLVALALTVVAFVFQYLREPDLAIDPTTSYRWSPVAGSVAGLMQGAVGVSGPVVAAWLHSYRLPPRAYVFSITLIFGVTGAVQLAVLLAQGEVTGERVLASLFAAVPVAVAIPIGLRLRSHLAGPAFERAVLAVLLASAASLLVQVVV